MFLLVGSRSCLKGDEVLPTLNDSELLKCYRLDRAWIMFSVDLIRNVLTSPASRSNAIREKWNKSDHEDTAPGRLQQCSDISRVITQTVTASSQSGGVMPLISSFEYTSIIKHFVGYYSMIYSTEMFIRGNSIHISNMFWWSCKSVMSFSL